MKKLLIVIALLADTASLSVAQQGERMRATPEQRAQKQTDRMTQSLKLTSDQQKQVYDVNLKAAQQMKPMQGATDEDRKAFRDAQQQKDASLRTILSADQYQQYEKMKQDMMNRMRERRNGDSNNSPEPGN